jgi:hypothetical protein
MCNSCNTPNCGCSPCQECNNPVPQQTCTTTCTCTTEQFTEECPCGLQSTNCLIYTGDNLQDCEGDDYLFRGTNFNTFLSQLWDTVKCAAAPTTNTIEYTGANIRNCDNTATVVATGSSLTVALNNIWNALKCAYTDINQRQPVWQGSSNIIVGVAQTAPYDNINTALVELAKFHFNVPVTIKLEDGIHTLTNEFAIQNFLNDKNTLILDSVSGIKENVFLRTTSSITLNFGNLTASNISLQTNSTNTLLNVKNSGTSVILNNVKVLAQVTPNNVFKVSLNASLSLDNCLIEDSDITNFFNSIFYLDTGSSLTINGGSHSINKKFIESRQSSLKMTNSIVTFSNLANVPLVELISDSRLNLENSRFINSAPSNFNSICFSLDQSSLRADYAYSTPTQVISGFYFGLASKSSNVFLSGSNLNTIYSIVQLINQSSNSSFHIQGGKVISFDYTKRTIGIDTNASNSIIENTNMELHAIYNSSFGGKTTIYNNTFLFNTTYATANPGANKYFIWEDGANVSSFYGNTINFNNLSVGIRTSVQGTQYWFDDPTIPASLNTFLNIPLSATLRADFSSVIYAVNLDPSLPRSVGANSFIY